MQTLMNKVLPLPKVISRRLPETTYHVAGVPHELPIEIDHNGSPVSKRPSEWFVCFVPGLQKQWWHRFANPRHQHVFALKMVEDNHWVVSSHGGHASW
jgi:hypothetical protein